MGKALSIHIGLNRVDATAYGGWDGQLSGCINDARAMEQIATSQGFQTRIMTDAQATCPAVTGAIISAAGQLQSGDILLLTYSGHGGEVPDPTGTEPTGKNQTWVLYDRMLVDDELYALWGRFQAGVRIFVLSDSCHSGTVTREVQYRAALTGNPHLTRAYRTRSYRDVEPARIRFKNMPLDVNQRVYRHYRTMYDVISTYTPKEVPVQATVILISGCQDNQLSMDGAGNGLFTEKLLATWNQPFHGDYRGFSQAIIAKMPPTQVPNYYVVGAPNAGFEAQQPFSTPAPGTQTSTGTGTAGGTDEGGGSWGGGSGDTGGGDESGGWGTDTGDTGDSGSTDDSGWGTDTGDSGSTDDSGWGTDSGDSGSTDDSGWGTDSGDSGGTDDSGSTDDSGWGTDPGDSGSTDDSGWATDPSDSGDSGDSGTDDSGWGDSTTEGDDSSGWS